MYALSSKSGSEPFRFALFLGDLRWNDPIAVVSYKPIGRHTALHGTHTQSDRFKYKHSILQHKKYLIYPIDLWTSETYFTTKW